MAQLTQAPAGAGVQRTADADYLRGVLLVALAGAFWSIGGVLVRWVEGASAWQIIFYRSVALALTLLLIIAIRHRGRLVAAFAGIGGVGLLAGVCLSGGFIGYVLALHYTSVANAVFMLGTAPFFAAILGRWFLREEVRRATWLAMVLALCGIAVMVAGSLVLGTVTGNLLALGASLSFAGFNVLLRRGRAHDMMPCVVIAGLVAAAIAAPVVIAGPGGFVVGA
jgi:drug/metabolite transporter, DME family